MSKLLRSLSCGTMKRRPRTSYQLTDGTAPTTAAAAATSASSAKKKSAKEVVDFNFWDIDSYESALDRCNDGNDICENLIDMLNERAKVEENYSKALLGWQKKWTDFLNKESKEYGSTKVACLGMLQTAEKLAEYHNTIQANLIDKTKSPVTEIKNWMNKNYAKEHIHFRKRNEFDDKFKYAQKPWADYNKEIEKAKKDYHQSVKETAKAEQAFKKVDKNPKVREEERVKLRKEADKYLDAQKKDRAKYEDKLKIPEKLKQNYVEDMKKVFEKTQEFEVTRMQFVKDIYSQFRACFVNANFYDMKVRDGIFRDFTDKITRMDPTKDVKWWADTYGAGMQPRWPTFAEYGN